MILPLDNARTTTRLIDDHLATHSPTFFQTLVSPIEHEVGAAFSTNLMADNGQPKTL